MIKLEPQDMIKEALATAHRALAVYEDSVKPIHSGILRDVLEGRKDYKKHYIAAHIAAVQPSVFGSGEFVLKNPEESRESRQRASACGELVFEAANIIWWLGEFPDDTEIIDRISEEVINNGMSLGV